MGECGGGPKWCKAMISVLVASKGRREMLLRRCLGSVNEQRRLPERVVVVMDEDFEEELVGAIQGVLGRMPAERVEVVRNVRSAGASGAWNTGIIRIWGLDSEGYIAILDDDDAWEAGYLEAMGQVIEDKGADFLYGRLIRIRGDERKALMAEQGLDGDCFLSHNPGIQGSNMVARTQLLVGAGLFDEGLVSTTDRDLGYRIWQMPGARKVGVGEAVALHYAEDGWLRLSQAGHGTKLEGLRWFWKKYRMVMGAEQRRGFLARAERVFGFGEAEFLVEAENKGEEKVRDRRDGGRERVPLCVGFILTNEWEEVWGLLNDVVHLAKAGEVGVVVLENGRPPTGWVERAVAMMDQVGVRLEYWDVVKQGELGKYYQGLPAVRHGRPIWAARSTLQKALYLCVQAVPQTITWVVDADVRLFDPALGGVDANMVRDKWEALLGLGGNGAAACIGRVLGDAPLPTASTLRTQALDAWFTLKVIGEVGAEGFYPDFEARNKELCGKLPDYYYDHSNGHYGHLEMPMPLIGKGWNGKEALKRLAEGLEGIFSGKAVFRPILGDGEESAFEWARHMTRGGNMVVYHANMLRSFLQYVPEMGGRATRRSDTVWCLLQHHVLGRRIGRVGLAVYQQRAVKKGAHISWATLVDDVRGHAASSALNDLFRRKGALAVEAGQPDFGRHLLDEAAGDGDFLVERYGYWKGRKVEAIRLNLARTRVLVVQVKAVAEGLMAGGEWKEKTSQARLGEIVAWAGRMQAELVEGEGAIRALDTGDGEAIKDYLARLRREVGAELEAVQPLGVVLEGLMRGYVEKVYGTGGLELLGSGSEGVVYTNRVRVYKVLYPALRQIDEAQWEWLCSAKHWAGGEGPIPAFNARRDGEWVSFNYKYEVTEEVREIMPGEAFRFLLRMKAQGAVVKNIKLGNLRRGQEGLVYIDLGVSVIPYTANDFELMARKMYLLCRYEWVVPEGMLSRSLVDGEMPELYGFGAFHRALNLSVEEAYWKLVMEVILGGVAGRVLDYGCGSGLLKRLLDGVGAGKGYFGYDPKEGEGMGECFTKDVDEIKRQGLFETAVLGRVACEVDDQEMGRILRRIRGQMVKGGRLVFTICNPFYDNIEETTLHKRALTCAYEERGEVVDVRAKGDECLEYHRPYHVYQKALGRAGFRIMDVRETEGYAPQSCTPASDFLIVVAEAVEVVEGCTLLIKTCGQEHGQIGAQVKHLVRQLRAWECFEEVVVVADLAPRRYVRQYAEADGVATLKVLRELEGGGWIDAVLVPEKGEVEATMAAWFGRGEGVEYAVNGQHVYPTLWALGQMRSRYVFQTDSDMLYENRGWDGQACRALLEEMEAQEAWVAVSPGLQGVEERAWDTRTRFEVRSSLVDLERLRGLLPLENGLIWQGEGRMAWEMGWHRALDKRVKGWEGIPFVRGGVRGLGVIHVANAMKGDVDEWLGAMCAFECGLVPQRQAGQVEWMRGKEVFGVGRIEEMVVVVTFRNPGAGRLKACMDSLAGQSYQGWGLVVMDDGSSGGEGDYVEEVLARGWAGRCSVVRRKERVSQTRNLRDAIQQICGNGESIVVTLDGDDGLIGRDTLGKVLALHREGAEVTVGTMVRTDKVADYVVDFEDCRNKRGGGNVWQHLRSFRKRLFDMLGDGELMYDGEWTDVANDWRYMIPMVERAGKRVWLREKVYFHAPSVKGEGFKEMREVVIGKWKGGSQ